MIVEVFRGPECAQRLNFIRSLGYEVSHLEDNDFLCIPLKFFQAQACDEQIPSIKCQNWYGIEPKSHPFLKSADQVFHKAYL